MAKRRKPDNAEIFDKKTLAIFDKEFEEDRKKREHEKRVFGEKRLKNVETVHHMMIDDVRALLKGKPVSSVTVTLRIQLKNGEKYEHASCSIPGLKPWVNKKGGKLMT